MTHLLLFMVFSIYIPLCIGENINCLEYQSCTGKALNCTDTTEPCEVTCGLGEGQIEACMNAIINCNRFKSCENAKIYGNNATSLNVTTSISSIVTGQNGFNACLLNAQIHCNSTSTCDITCTAQDYQCKSLKIYAEHAETLIFRCEEPSSHEQCRYMSIYCPTDSHDESCHIIGSQGITQSNIYSETGFNGLIIDTDLSSTGQNMMYCCPEYDQSCNIFVSPSEIRCSKSGLRACDDNLMECPALPTDDPTNIPTNVPTTTSPTVYPTNIPTDNPTNRPSIEPTTIPPSFPSVLPTLLPTTLTPTNPTVIPTIHPINIPTNAIKNVTTTSSVIYPTNISTKTTQTETNKLDQDEQVAKKDKQIDTYIIVLIAVLYLCIVTGIVMFIKKQKQKQKLDKPSTVSGPSELNMVPVTVPDINKLRRGSTIEFYQNNDNGNDGSIDLQQEGVLNLSNTKTTQQEQISTTPQYPCSTPGGPLSEPNELINDKEPGHDEGDNSESENGIPNYNNAQQDNGVTKGQDSDSDIYESDD